MSENKKVTLILDLQDQNFKENFDNKIYSKEDKNELSLNIVDLSLELDFRIKNMEIYYKLFGQEESNELVNRLSNMYSLSGTKILEKYLYEMCVNCKISAILKINIAKSLCYFDIKKDIGFNALNNICKDMKEVATPCKIDAIYLLMVNEKFKEESLEYLCNIINDNVLDCDYRYKIILSLENREISKSITSS